MVILYYIKLRHITEEKIIGKKKNRKKTIKKN
jgi:hypothetical protein